MSTDDDQIRLPDETERLLSTEDRDDSQQQQRPRNGSEHWIWTQWQSYALRNARKTLRSNKVYLLLVFAPLGIAAGAFRWNSVLISIFNLLAIVPLSALVSYSSDKLSDIVGELVGGLINATFGNTVELVVGILALIHGKTSFVQSVMLGSILSDLLLVLGCCIFSAASGQQAPEFNAGMADALSSLMIITATALILPTALYSTFTSAMESQFADKILAFSRGSAIVLLGLYGAYLYFQLSHPEFFLSTPEEEPMSAIEDRNNSDGQLAASSGVPSATAILLLATAGIITCAHFLLDSVDDTAEACHITKTFIAAIIIPIASNAPEAATIMTVGRGCKVNYGIGVVVGSILQIALSVIPFLVILGWIIDQPLTLYFETFQTTMLFLSVLVVNRLLQDRIYTYVQGAMLVALYAIIATVFFLRPEVASDTITKLMI